MSPLTTTGIVTFCLTARTAAGTRTTKHVLVVELAQSVAQPEPVVEPQPVVAQPVAPQITVQPQSQAVPVGKDRPQDAGAILEKRNH